MKSGLASLWLDPPLVFAVRSVIEAPKFPVAVRLFPNPTSLTLASAMRTWVRAVWMAGCQACASAIAVWRVSASAPGAASRPQAIANGSSRRTVARPGRHDSGLE